MGKGKRFQENFGFPLTSCTRLSAWLPRHFHFLPKIPYTSVHIYVLALLGAQGSSFIWSPFYKKFYKLCHPVAISFPDCSLQKPYFSFLWTYPHTLDLLHIFFLHSEGLINEKWLSADYLTALTHFTAVHTSWCPASFLNSTIILMADSQWVAFCDSCVFFYHDRTRWIHSHLVFMHLGFPP